MTSEATVNRVAVFSVVWVLAAWPASAEETVAYESLSEIMIGRVFLSQNQRSMLDDGRGSEPVVRQAPTKPAAAAPRKKNKRKPAGYIVSSTGESRVWSDRGFVARQPASRMRFPGDVVVTRGKPSTTETQRAADERESGSSNEGS